MRYLSLLILHILACVACELAYFCELLRGTWLFWRRSRHPARKSPFSSRDSGSSAKIFPWTDLNSHHWACSIDCGEKTPFRACILYTIYEVFTADVLYCGLTCCYLAPSGELTWIVCVLCWCFEGFPSSNMSLWVDKYRPTSLSKLDYHKDLATHLRKLVRELFTNTSCDLLRHDGSSHFELITS